MNRLLKSFSESKKNQMVVLTVAFLFVVLITAYGPQIEPFRQWLTAPIPVALANIDLAVLGTALIALAHAKELSNFKSGADTYILALAILALLFAAPSYNSLQDTPLGEIGGLYLAGAAFYWAIVTMLRPFVNPRRRN